MQWMRVGWVLVLTMENLRAQGMRPGSTFMPPPNVGMGSGPTVDLRGRKLVDSWNGDLVDCGQSAALGLVTGGAIKVALKLATGIAYNVAVASFAIAIGAWSGLLTIHWIRLRQLVTKFIPENALPTGDSIFERLDLDGDKKLSKEDVQRLKAQIRTLAERNGHATLGGLSGLLVGFVFA